MNEITMPVSALVSRSQQTFGIYPKLASSDKQSLVDYSREDEAISRFTRDRERFSDIDAVNLWLEQKRYIYTLVSEEDMLAGIIWFREKMLPQKRKYLKGIRPDNFGITFAIRMYQLSRGQGLANPFMHEVFNEFITSEDYSKLINKNFWLEVSAGNEAAVGLYQKFGFVQADDPDEEDKMHMTFIP